MKAQELRIGNWLYDVEDGEYQVEQICTHRYDSTLIGVVWRKRSCWTAVEETQPIPLTPEWLERFGFEYEEGFADDYTKEPISLYNNPFLEGWTVETIFSELIKKNMLNIKYVHQLQNLYFALTGQELELK